MLLRCCARRTASPSLSISQHFDLIVLGSGPAGQKCAVDSAKRGKSVAVVDASLSLGGVCVHTGTIPSKTLREAIINSTGYRTRNVYGVGQMRRIDTEDIFKQVRAVQKRQADVILNQLKRNKITILNGKGCFHGPNTIEVTNNAAEKPHTYYSAEKVLIAVGTHPNRGKEFPFELQHIYDSDEVCSDELVIPRSLIVVGGGVIGIEYATMFSAIPGTSVVVVDGNSSLLPFCDSEVVDLLIASFRTNGGRLILNDTVVACDTEKGKKVHASLASGKILSAEALLFCMGRQACTESLHLKSLGVATKKRGQLAVTDQFQVLTKEGNDGVIVPGVYAAGDVIGAPALASTAMEQGRRASCHMWGETGIQNVTHDVFPYGIYSVPEMSCVGKTEQELSTAGVAYEVGAARYKELARSHLVGDELGLLKILFCPTTLKIYGVHVIGDGATEIAHIGQVVMALGGTLEYFRNTVFNYPTFAEGYRAAALAGMGKVRSYPQK